MSSLRSTPSKKDPQKLFLELQKKNTEIESLQRSNDYLEKVIKDFGRSNHSTHQIDTTLVIFLFILFFFFSYFYK